MMKNILSILLIVLISFAVCTYFPWWSIAVVAFVISIIIPVKPVISFLNGFLALFLLWGGLSLYISLQNEHILAKRVAMLLLKNEQPYLLIFITSLIGGIVGGLSALCGSLLRSTFNKTK